MRSAMGMLEHKVDNVTTLLRRWSTGTADDRERLFAAVLHELKRIASAYMRRERPDHTLQPTALVNEAYLRLVDASHISWETRAHFYGIAARVMRQVLVDHARKRDARKRHGPVRADGSVTKIAGPSGSELDVLALHEALTALAALDQRQAEIVELRYFAGLTEEEVAKVKALSPATIRREVASARFWLGQRMQRGR